MAEEVGFEPTKGYKPLPVFKTGAFNRSATLPNISLFEKARILRDFLKYSITSTTFFKKKDLQAKRQLFFTLLTYFLTH